MEGRASRNLSRDVRASTSAVHQDGGALSSALSVGVDGREWQTTGGAAVPYILAELSEARAFKRVWEVDLHCPRLRQLCRSDDLILLTARGMAVSTCNRGAARLWQSEGCTLRCRM